MAAAVALVANLLTVAAGDASAAPTATSVAAPPAVAQTVQYWDQRPYEGNWERRHQWREWRREGDEALMARQRGAKPGASSRNASSAGRGGTSKVMARATNAVGDGRP